MQILYTVIWPIDESLWCLILIQGPNFNTLCKKKIGTLLLSYVHSLPNQYFVFVKYNLHGSFLIFCKIVLFLLDFKVNMLLQLLLPKSEASQKTSFHAAVANLKLAIHSVEIAEIYPLVIFFVKFPWNQHIKY